MKYLFPLCLLLTACGQFRSLPQIVSASPEFEPHVEEYLRQKLKYLGYGTADFHIYIVFADLPDNILGECHGWQQDEKYDRYVKIEPYFWKYMVDSDREQLIFHELGHCDLNLDHGRGIMDEYQLDTMYYRNNRKRLIEEFFYD